MAARELRVADCLMTQWAYNTIPSATVCATFSDPVTAGNMLVVLVPKGAPRVLSVRDVLVSRWVLAGPVLWEGEWYDAHYADAPVSGADSIWVCFAEETCAVVRIAELRHSPSPPPVTIEELAVALDAVLVHHDRTCTSIECDEQVVPSGYPDITSARALLVRYQRPSE